jgi:hypothetical protein
MSTEPSDRSRWICLLAGDTETNDSWTLARVAGMPPMLSWASGHVEGQPGRYVRQLAHQGILRRLQPAVINRRRTATAWGAPSGDHWSFSKTRDIPTLNRHAGMAIHDYTSYRRIADVPVR